MAVVDSTIPQIVKAGQEAKVTANKKQANKDLQKTRLCAYNLEGKCGYGSNCSFAHSAIEIKNVPDLRKTQLCAKFAEGKCTNKKCSYAHGEAELRDPPNFKKKICKWHTNGNCRNGVNCGFVHEVSELRAAAPPPGFAPIGAKAPLNAKKVQQMPAYLELPMQKVQQVTPCGPPPGLTLQGVEYDCDASTDAEDASPSLQSQSESELSPTFGIPEEHLFRMMAGRGSAPLQHQVSLMTSAIGGLQAKLSQLEDMMLQNQVIQMQQQIEMLSSQCLALESGLTPAQQQPAPVAPTSLKSRLNRKAAPFTPMSTTDGKSDDSTSVGSE